jgi:hypothetical protein
MILIAETNVLVECSVEHAFSVVSNMERFGEWFPEVISISSMNDLNHGEVNKTYVELVSVPLQGKRSIEIVVKESVPCSRFVTEGKLFPLLPRMEIELLTQAESKTNIKWRMLSRSKSRIVKLLLLPVAKVIMQKRAAAGVFALKSLLEGGIHPLR